MARRKSNKRVDWSRFASSPAPAGPLPVLAPHPPGLVFCVCKGKEVPRDQYTFCQGA